jgi:hypothetical protein
MINFSSIGRRAKMCIWKVDVNELEDIYCYGPVNKK